MDGIFSKLYSGNAIVLSMDVRSSAIIYSLKMGQDISFFKKLHSLYRRIIEKYQSEMLINVTIQGDGLLAVFKGEESFSNALGMINDFFYSFKKIMLEQFNVNIAPVACIGMGQVDCFTTDASIRYNEPLFIGSIVHDVVHMARSLDGWHYAVQNSMGSEFVIRVYKSA